LDAYCRILLLSKQLGRISYFSEGETRELLELKKGWGFSDARLEPGMENCDICANDVFRDSWKAGGISRTAFDAPPPMPARGAAPAQVAASTGNADQEALVKAITERVLAALK
jgi:L-fuculose-phosphate aldolase